MRLKFLSNFFTYKTGCSKDMAKLRNLVFKMRILVAVPADGTRWVSNKGLVRSKEGKQARRTSKHHHHSMDKCLIPYTIPLFRLITKKNGEYHKNACCSSQFRRVARGLFLRTLCFSCAVIYYLASLRVRVRVYTSNIDVVF